MTCPRVEFVCWTWLTFGACDCFADKGPYTVRMADRSVIISDTSEVGFKDYQVGNG
jgi:hypothetical protein